MNLFFLLFLLLASFTPGLQDEEANTEVMDKIIEYFEELAKPSDNYLDRLNLFEKTIPSLLNLSESFGDLFFSLELSGNSGVPDYLTRDTMDVPSATKLFKYFDEQYGLANLTERTSTRRSNSYVHTIVLKNDEEATYSYSLYGNISLVLNHYFKSGFMGFLNPTVSPEGLSENLKNFYRLCKNENVGIESMVKEMNKWLVKSCMNRNNTDLRYALDSFLDVLRHQYFWFTPNYIDDKNTLTIWRFRAHMLSMEDTEWRAVEMVEKMEEKVLRKSFANTKKEEIRALLDEAFNVTAKRTPCLLDMITSYDRREIAAFMNDMRVEMSRMLVSALLCAAPNPKGEKTTLETVGNLVSETANFLAEYFPKRLKTSIREEEKIVKRILNENKREKFFSRDGYYIPDNKKVLEQWNYTLSNVGHESIRRQYLINVYGSHFSCKSGSCILFQNTKLYQPDAFVARYTETNETAVEEFTKQAKALYRRILPIVTSSNKKWDTVKKLAEEIERRNISLTDTHIGSTAIMRHLKYEHESCYFQTSFLLYNRGEGNLPAVVSYSSRSRVSNAWFWDDKFACTEIYFFM